MEKEKQQSRDLGHTILLFYKYVPIRDPEEVKNEHAHLWSELGLTGRLIVAEEGINGTCEGEKEAIERYKEHIRGDARFSDIAFKESVGTGNAFPRASVKVRSEIVSSYLEREKDVDPRVCTGVRLSPEELHQWFEEGRSFYIVDMRNDYEYKVGRFKGSLFSGMKNFRDLESIVPDLEKLKDEVVVTVCTGGVRCEKASGFLVQQGFRNIYQLDGGIVSYMEKFPNSHFKGTLYVFDQRVTMDFDDPDKHEIVGRCEKCDTATERFADCGRPECHRHFLCCSGCFEGEVAFCSETCKETEQNKRVVH